MHYDAVAADLRQRLLAAGDPGQKGQRLADRALRAGGGATEHQYTEKLFNP